MLLLFEAGVFFLQILLCIRELLCGLFLFSGQFFQLLLYLVHFSLLLLLGQFGVLYLELKIKRLLLYGFQLLVFFLAGRGEFGYLVFAGLQFRLLPSDLQLQGLDLLDLRLKLGLERLTVVVLAV